LTDPAIVYFPGLRFEGEVGVAKAMMTIPKPEYTKEDLPIFYRLGWGGHETRSSGERESWRWSTATSYVSAVLDAAGGDSPRPTV
jgi:hypothetical protein